MASLKKVVEQLRENKEAQDETTDQVTGLSGRIGELIKGMRIDKLDLLETLRERKSQPAPRQAAAVAGSGGGGGGFNLGLLGLAGLAPALSALGATLIAVTASFTGLDDALRAVPILRILNSFRLRFLGLIKTITRITDTILEVFRPLTKLPEAIRAAFFALPDGLLKALKTFAVVGFGDMAADAIRIKTAISTFFEPVRNFFKAIGQFFEPIVKGIKGTVIAAKDVLTPIIEFLKNVAGVFKPLLTPLIGFVKLVARPFVQILLSIIDFFVGFVEGFKSEKEGEFKKKLLSGFEGGIKGVIKGITDAIDLIFIDLPAFIAEKLGFKSFAKTLREFSLTDLVDPAFEAVKNFFKLAFSDAREAFAPLINTFKSLPLQFLQKVIRAILPPEDMFKIKIPEVNIPGFGKIGGKTVDFNPFPESLYKFGEIDLSSKSSSVSSVPSTTGTAVQNSGFQSFGQPNMQIVDQSSRTGDIINQNQGFVYKTNAYDSMDPYIYRGAISI